MRVAIFLAVAFGAVASAHGQLVLDNYTTGSTHYSVLTGTTYTNQAGSMVGGQRTTGTQILQNPFSTPLDVDVANGFLSFSQGSGVTSNVGIGYGYTALADHSGFSTFDLGLNLSSYSYFTLDVAFDEASLPVEIELNNNAAEVYQFTISPRTVETTYQVSFSQFSGVNFSDIHQIAINFQDPTSNDFTLGNFGAASQAPEPMSCAFLGLGAIGLIARRLRKKSA